MTGISIERMMYLAQSSRREWKKNDKTSYLVEDMSDNRKFRIVVGYENPIDAPCEDKYFLEIQLRFLGEDVTLMKEYHDLIKNVYDKIDASYNEDLESAKQDAFSVLNLKYEKDKILLK